MAFGWDDAAIGGIGLIGNLLGASSQAKAAKEAARIQSQTAMDVARMQDQANQRGEVFLRQQAQNAWANSEATRRANYDQWRAREARLGSIGEALGYGRRAIPSYTPSVNPKFDGSLGWYLMNDPRTNSQTVNVGGGITPAAQAALAGRQAPLNLGAYL